MYLENNKENISERFITVKVQRDTERMLPWKKRLDDKGQKSHTSQVLQEVSAASLFR